MKKYTLLFLSFVFGKYLLAQNPMVNRSFVAQTNTCINQSSVKVVDYVVDFFDSNVVHITTYTKSTATSAVLITKELYIGVYQIKNDTISITYLSHTTEVKNKYPSSGKNPFQKQIDYSLLYPPTNFFLASHAIVAKDKFYPILDATTNATTLHKIFDNWDKNISPSSHHSIFFK